MRYLLDTCTLLWVIKGTRRRIPRAALAAIESPENEIWVSTVSIWEMAIKMNLGKLELPQGVGNPFRTELQKNRFRLLNVEYDHAGEVTNLPSLKHRDPFDRLLIAQARVERLTVITNDPNWSHPDYALDVVWK